MSSIGWLTPFLWKLYFDPDYIYDGAKDCDIYMDDNELKIVINKAWSKEDWKKDNLFQTIKCLKEKEREIYISDGTFFTVDDFYATSKKEVRWIKLTFNQISYINYFLDMICRPEVDNMRSKVRYLKMLSYLAYSLGLCGLQLQEIQDIDTLLSIPNLLSSFTYSDEHVGSKNMLKFAHMLMTGTEFDEDELVNSLKGKKFISDQEIPYTTEIFKYVVKYSKNGQVDRLIYNTFMNLDEDHLDADKNIKETITIDDGYYIQNYAISESNSWMISKKLSFLYMLDDSDITYDNGKAYCRIGENDAVLYKPENEELKWIVNNFQELYDYSQTADLLEKINTIIINSEYQFVGYTYQKENEIGQNLLDVKTSTQKDLFEFIDNLIGFYNKLTYDYGAKRTTSEAINIEDYIVFDTSNFEFSKNHFKIKSISSIYTMVKSRLNLVNHSIMKVCFEMLKGRLDNNVFWKNKEVRYLPPVLAVNLEKYVSNQNCDLSDCFDYLITFLERQHYISEDNSFIYDNSFNFNPKNQDYFFDTEIKEEYGVDINGKDEVMLPDGKRYFSLKGQKEISFNNNKVLAEKLSQVSKDLTKLHTVKLSSLIYKAPRIYQRRYELLGYISEPFDGEALSDEKLRLLTNKELYFLFGRLLPMFVYGTFPLNCVYVTKDFEFYINTYNSNFSFSYPVNYTVAIKDCIKKLEVIGYNKRVTEALLKEAEEDFQKIHYSDCQKYYELKAQSVDAFCVDHGLYYNSENGECPLCKLLKSKVRVEDLELVFEDENAIHYKYSQEYNVKIYKSSKCNLTELHQNVLGFINKRFDASEVLQKCFIPLKLAVDDNQNFIGYLYKPEEFKIDIEDTTNNLARIKVCFRLATQVKQLEENGFGFSFNPFGRVFLNSEYKKQVQILNVDYLRKKVNKNTAKWTLDYIKQIIENSNDLFFHISKLKTLDEVIDILGKKAKKFTKFCRIHGIYYDNEQLFCPCCVDEKNMQNINTKYEDKSVYDHMTSINEGGEAMIYNVHGQIVKIFNESIDINFKNAVLYRIMKKREILENIDMKYNGFRYILPDTILIDKINKEMFGYSMERIQDAEPISLLRDKSIVQDKYGFTRLDILQIAINIGKGIEFLHQQGMFIGDLNGSNILFDSQKCVYFIDFDGMGVDEIKPEYCTDGYIDPISKKNGKITENDDWYSLAIQIFHYLTYTHPFNGVYYEIVNGTKVALDIVDKMEKRISLLGNHGIKMPDVAEPWEWMDKELVQVFFEIFEQEKRVSIVPYLMKQFLDMLEEYENPEKYRDFMEDYGLIGYKISINDKFEAIDQTLLDELIFKPVEFEEISADDFANEKEINLEQLEKYIRHQKLLNKNVVIKNTTTEDRYRVLCDSVSKMIVVINSQGEIYSYSVKNNLLHQKGKYNLNVKLNLKRVVFRKGNLFIPQPQKLLIVNANNQTEKNLECGTIMSIDSWLYNFTEKGFNVKTDGKYFKIRKK